MNKPLLDKIDAVMLKKEETARKLAIKKLLLKNQAGIELKNFL